MRSRTYDGVFKHTEDRECGPLTEIVLSLFMIGTYKSKLSRMKEIRCSTMDEEAKVKSEEDVPTKRLQRWRWVWTKICE